MDSRSEMAEVAVSKSGWAIGRPMISDFSTAPTEACLRPLIALLMAYGVASPVLAFRISGKRPYVKPITPVKDP